MRGLAFLLVTAGLLWLSPAFTAQTPSPKKSESDEQKLRAAGINTDDAALLDYLKARTLTEDERERFDALIAQLGASSFKVREQASQEIIAKGPAILELLRLGLNHPDLEIQRRCETCISKIKERDHSPDVSAAVVRLIGIRRPAGAVPVLLNYLPFVENEGAADDIRDVLEKLAVKDGKADKMLLAALKDKLAARRAAAGQALALSGAYAEHKAAIRALLKDPDLAVRFRVATALVTAKDAETVPVLIDLLPEATQFQAWQIEDTLYRLAEGSTPPNTNLGDDEAARRKCRDAWKSWWHKNGAAVDLAVLRNPPPVLGRTTMVLLELNCVIEMQGDKKLWQIDNLGFPLDIQVLDNDRVLVTEFGSNRVTERNLKGQILWHALCPEPQMAQRLPNGNTFIGTRYRLVELTPANKEVYFFNVPPGGEGIMKCVKLPTGDIVCIYESGRVVRMDSNNKELSSFRVPIAMPLFGGRLSVLPTGRVLIPHHSENKVVEYDSTGKVVWEVNVRQPIVATRLPNGNTLVTSMTDQSSGRAVEFDRNGNEVWQFSRTDSRVTRAIRH